MKRFLIIVLIFLAPAYASNMSQERLIPTYLYNFAKYTNWPEDYDKKVFEIYLVSSNKTLYRNMKDIVKEQKLHAKPIKVSIGSAQNIPFTSDLIYVDKGYLKSYQKIYTRYEGRPVLLVSNAYDNKRLVMINLKKTKDETLGFEVNKENILNQDLSINPQLILFGGTELDVAKLYKEAKDSLLQKEVELQKQLKKAQLLSQEIKTSKNTNIALEKSIFEKNTKLEETETRISDLSSDMKTLQDAIVKMDEKAKRAEAEFILLLKKQKEILAFEKASTKQAKQRLLKQEHEVRKKEKELSVLSKKVQDKAIEFKRLQEDLVSAGVQIKDKDEIIHVQQDYLFFLGLATALFLSLVLIILRVLRQKGEANKELKLTQGALEDQVKKTQKADASKTKFLAHMSHELRTPLNAVLGYSQILQKDPLMSQKNQKTIATINRSGEHLLALINDVLEVSKIETGNVDLDPVAFDLFLFLDDVYNMFSQKVQDAGLYLELEKSKDLPQFISADINKIRQIFINFLGNSVKFTERGGIKIKIDTKAKKQELMIQIQDSGVGIAEEEIAKLFKPFKQTMSGKIGGGGAGLGLSIVMEYIDLMKGNINVQSEPEIGTSFYITVPFETASITEARENENKEIISLRDKDRGIELLIADDNETNNDLLEELLVSVGFKVYKAKNGEEALASFKEYQPRAVLLDIDMPLMNGYEAAMAIKALDYGAETPIIAVTASIFDVSHTDVLKQGFDDLIHKPFKDYDIYMALAKFLHLKYVYKDEEIQTEEVEVRLEGLDNELRNNLLQALKKMKIASVKDLLSQVEKTHPQEAKLMQDLAEDFEYDKLQTLLQES